MRTVFVIYESVDGGGLGKPLFSCKAYTKEGALELFRVAKKVTSGSYSAVPMTKRNVKVLIAGYKERYEFWKQVGLYLCEEELEP